MKINGTIFSKPQQDQLKRGIGAELDKVVAKVEDVDARMLNYTGDWVTGNEYHENDVVTWGTDGHLYEVIKAHTSSSTIDPSNTEYYKAMTAAKYIKHTYTNLEYQTAAKVREILNIFNKSKTGKNIFLVFSEYLYTITACSPNNVDVVSFGNLDNGARISFININSSNFVKSHTIIITPDGTTSTFSSPSAKFDIFEEV